MLTEEHYSQTPTFNAKPIIRAALEACRRGIQVTIYVDLGFNDKGESMPFQGGTNEEVVERMYKDLNTTGHQKNLHVFWYVGKDQVRPLNAVKKQRNCHVKVGSHQTCILYSS
jgi:UDP:flavonoid glycosyltransferase YjiC (YdhE family)